MSLMEILSGLSAKPSVGMGYIRGEWTLWPPYCIALILSGKQLPLLQHCQILTVILFVGRKICIVAFSLSFFKCQTRCI